MVSVQTYEWCLREEVYDQYNDGHWGNYVTDYVDYRLRLDLPQYNDNMNIEDFIDWMLEVERFFDYMDIVESRKVKLVALRFKDTTSAWWD